MSPLSLHRLGRAVAPPPLRRRGLRRWIRSRGDPVRIKRTAEMDFWRGVFDRQGGRPYNGHFDSLFLGTFGLTGDFYEGKCMLDVGCGPAGSLEWAAMAEERVGLDPLVGKYRSLGIDEQLMRYVEARSEEMPFRDQSFDIVSSLNSLDHVEDVERTIAEMVRVLRVNGSLLLIVEVNHAPMVTEPASLPWDLSSWFGPSMRTVFERRYESSGADWFYRTVFADQRWDDTRAETRPGVLVARFQKRHSGT